MPKLPSENEPPKGEKESKRLLVPLVNIVGILLVGGALAGAGYFYIQAQQTEAQGEGSETEALVQTIGQFLELPSNETPTVATVTDSKKLAEQPFFQKAENGDKVLIFMDARRAILYRPSLNKIIDVTTINTEQVAAGETEEKMETAAPAVFKEDATFTLYNGSSRIGVTAAIETKLQEQFPSVQVADKQPANNKDYQGITVIDIGGDKSDQAEKIAEALGGTTAPLPENETVPSTDFLVIVGN